MATHRCRPHGGRSPRRCTERKKSAVDWEHIARSVILAVFGNRGVSAAAGRLGMRLGAGRFIAGTSVLDAIDTVARLNAQGIMATLDYLGEAVTEPAEALVTVNAYQELLDQIASAGLTANVSLKLTALGLAIRDDLALEYLRHIVAHARARANLVRIDMEDTPYTEATLRIYRTLRAEGFDNVGVVIQAYLYRSDRDLEELAKQGANVRLVKGAYREPRQHAYPRKADVDAAFLRQIEARLRSGLYTAVATHDERSIAFTRQLVTREGLPRDRFEFQMLYGIRPELQERLVHEGYRVRTYVPYGDQWYPYFIRRLAERPANLSFVVRNLFRT